MNKAVVRIGFLLLVISYEQFDVGGDVGVVNIDADFYAYRTANF